MQVHPPVRTLDPATADFYRACLEILSSSRIPFLLGGAYALGRYTGVHRHTKDLDVFLCAKNAVQALEALSAAGYKTERTFPHWLSKVFGDGAFVDIIHSSGNGIAKVDDEWFAHARDDKVLGVPVRLCAPEEMIWSKGFIMERERYDGSDIAHLILKSGRELDWDRLLQRFGSHGPVLLSHLILFRYVYPGQAALVPDWIIQRLLAYQQPDRNGKPTLTRLCRGTLLSREQYLVDVQERGYRDARLPPDGIMTPEEIERWTAGIDWNKV